MGMMRIAKPGSIARWKLTYVSINTGSATFLGIATLGKTAISLLTNAVQKQDIVIQTRIALQGKFVIWISMFAREDKGLIPRSPQFSFFI